MLKKLTLKQKMFFIPFLAALAFIIVFFITRSYSKKNEKLLSRVVMGYVPAWELNRDLIDTMHLLNQQMDETIKNRDEGGIFTLDTLRQQFLGQLESGKKNSVIEVNSIDYLRNLFEDYYTLTREICLRGIKGERIERLSKDLKAISNRFNFIKAKLNANIKQDQIKMALGLKEVQDNNRTMIFRLMVIMLVTISVFVTLIIGLSVSIIRAITGPIELATQVTEKIANGDLTVDIPVIQVNNESKKLMETFQRMVERLRTLIGRVKETANSLATASGEISSSVSQIASAATQTASAATETSTTVGEVRQISQDSNNKALLVTESARKAADTSQLGEKSVKDTISEINKIDMQMESIAESILNLSEHGQSIRSIIATVEEVTEQSRILAVNASIEAVKAGEHGKGFAVVAQEVRSLADQAKQATTRVRGILDDIQTSTSEAVMKTEQGSKAVKAGVEQSAVAGDTIQELADSVFEAQKATSQISVSSQEQLVGMDQVVLAMGSIKQASSQNVVATKQLESAARDLHILGEKLKDVVDDYNV